MLVGESGGGGGVGVRERERVGDVSRVMRLTVEDDVVRCDSCGDWEGGRDDVEVSDRGGGG